MVDDTGPESSDEVALPIVRFAQRLRQAEDASRAIDIRVGESGVYLNDELIVPLFEGRASDEHLRSTNSPMFPALQQTVADAIERDQHEAEAQGEPYEPVATLLVDARVPYRTLTSVVASASAAGAGRFRLAAREEGAEAVAVVPLHTPRMRSRPQPDPTIGEVLSPDGAREPQIDLPVPVIGITDRGFVLQDLRGSETFSNLFTTPAEGCPGSDGTTVVPAICSRDDGSPDFRRLYNRLVAIREHEGWSSLWDEEGVTFYVVADENTETAVVVRTLDTAAYYLELDTYDDDEAFASAPPRRDDSGEIAWLLGQGALMFGRLGQPAAPTAEQPPLELAPGETFVGRIVVRTTPHYAHVRLDDELEYTNHPRRAGTLIETRSVATFEGVDATVDHQLTLSLPNHEVRLVPLPAATSEGSLWRRSAGGVEIQVNELLTPLSEASQELSRRLSTQDSTLTGTITVRTEPVGAQVIYDGQRLVGEDLRPLRTPLTFDHYPGPNDTPVTLQAAGAAIQLEIDNYAPVITGVYTHMFACEETADRGCRYTYDTGAIRMFRLDEWAARTHGVE